MSDKRQSVFRDDLNALKALSELRADPNGIVVYERGGERYTLLEVAVQHRRSELVKILLEQGASANVGTPLIAAIAQWYYGQSEEDMLGMVSPLLDHTVEIDKQKSDGVTALMSASILPFESITNLLLQRGADYRLLDEDGNNALSLAYANFRGQTVALLRRAGATLPAGPDFQISDLHLSVVEGDLAECQHLIRAKADVNLLDACGLTPLHCAAHAGHVAVMRLLLDTGARIDQRSCDFDEQGNLLPEQGPTAIGHSIWGNQFEAVRFLLDAGADVHGRFFDGEGDGFTVLAWAAREGSWKKDTSILRLLLERGVRDDLRGALGRAAFWGFEEGVKLLLEYGAGKNRDDLLFAIKRTTEDNGLRAFPILYTAGQTLDPPLSLPEILSQLEEGRDGITFFALRALRDAGINPDGIE